MTKQTTCSVDRLRMGDGHKTKPGPSQRMIGLAAGFSLLEMLAVMAIAAIVLSMAMPSFGSFFDREKIFTVSDQFQSAVVAVRSSAIKSAIPVVLCASSDGSSCGESWSDGWLAFRDDNRDAVLDLTETMVLTHLSDSNATQISVASSGGDSLNAVSFNYRGSPGTALAISVSRGGQSRSMTVTPFGKLRHDQ